MDNNLDDLQQEFIEKQKVICSKYGAKFLASPFDHMVGIALERFNQFTMPINGLRHIIECEHSASWFIWAGDYSDAMTFLNVSHLIEICPKALNYLGLTSGWRFLFDNQYEDVWYDESLLNI